MLETERTISGALKWGTRHLQEKGIESPWVNAELLLRKTLDMGPVELYLHSNRALTKSQFASYKSLIGKRARGEPTQYILGRREFWSLDLKVAHGVFIPRPETELLVEEAVRIFRDERLHALQCMEVGTGSGAIAIALAKELKRCSVVAGDVSWEAVHLARENARIHGVSGRIRFLVGDAFSAIKGGKRRFDLIISNPPYIASSRIETLSREIAEFEPRIALDGGPDGLEPLRKIVVGTELFLKDGGWLMLEVGEEQGGAVAEMIRNTGFFEPPLIIKDHSGLDRVIRARKESGKYDRREIRGG
jgi:release factor glutamine methyltransferase